MQTQTLLKRTTFSVGICAVSETENTLRIAGQILATYDSALVLNQLIVATPNKRLADSLKNVDSRIIVLLEREQEGKIAALNKILRESSGDVFVLASADTKLESKSIHRLVQALVDNESWGLVDSRVELVNGERLLMDRISRLIWSIHNSTLDNLDEHDRLGHVAGDLFAVKRGLIDTLPHVINDDAYLALIVQRGGFRVKRVQDAVVWIVGPRSPADYVNQRSRVIRGHLQLIRLLGKMPSTLEFIVIRQPGQSIGLLVRTVAKHGHRYLMALFTAVLLEFLSFQMALISSFRRKDTKWRMVESTKKF